MKIGIFDSGVGGLIVAKAIRKSMPEYDYVYLGDTQRVPYGNRSHETVFEFTKEAINYLFKKENCAIVIIACNTSSARALRRIQEEYLIEYNATRKLMGETVERKVLGMIVPTAEVCALYGKVGVLGTIGTISSNAFTKEIQKVNQKTKVFQNSAPMLVPLAEAGEKDLVKPFLQKYLKPFVGKKLDALALGCTHYPFFKKEIKKEMEKILGKDVILISQDEIIPKKLKNYLSRHGEIDQKLSKNKNAKILVTDITPNFLKLTREWFGKQTKPELVEL